MTDQATIEQERRLQEALLYAEVRMAEIAVDAAKPRAEKAVRALQEAEQRLAEAKARLPKR